MRNTTLVSDVSDCQGFGILETLVAITVLAIGLLAASGLSSSATRLLTSASVLADQTAAAEAVFETMRRAGYAAAVSGADTITVGSARFAVEISVTALASGAKQIVVRVSGRRPAPEREFTTWMASEGSFPPPAAPPAAPPP